MTHTPRMLRYAAALCAVLLGTAAIAQDAATLDVELNAVADTESGCSISFLIANNLPQDIEALVLEAVLFNRDGQVDRLTLFDLGTLPAGRPRVRQFVVPDLACDALGSVLLNGAATCEIAGATSANCDSALRPSSRVDIELIG